MAEPSSLSIEHFFCHNSACADHGQRGGGNLYFRGFSGRDRRNNATDRRQNGRKQRKSYGFSRSKRMHDAATYFVSYSYNFCWAVRTLRVKQDGAWRPRTPAMAAGLTDRVWSLREWLTYPAKPCSPA